jgi:hypothetical protein
VEEVAEEVTEAPPDPLVTAPGIRVAQENAIVDTVRMPSKG